MKASQGCDLQPQNRFKNAFSPPPKKAQVIFKIPVRSKRAKRISKKGLNSKPTSSSKKQSIKENTNGIQIINFNQDEVNSQEEEDKDSGSFLINQELSFQPKQAEKYYDSQEDSFNTNNKSKEKRTIDYQNNPAVNHMIKLGTVVSKNK